MWIPGLLRLRGAGTTQMKLSVLPIHSSIHPHACLFLPPRPQVPRASVSPSASGCGHAHLTFRMRDPGGVGGGGDVGGRPGEAEPARVCEPTRLGVCAR